MRKILVIWLLGTCSSVWGADWDTMTVDVGAGEYGTSIALDSLEIPHIAYNKINYGLMYASWNPIDSIWVIEDISDSLGYGISGVQNSLAIDSKGIPHITVNSNGIRHVWKDSSGWHEEYLTSASYLAGTRLTLDKQEFLHIVFRNGDFLYHTYKDSSGWHTEMIDSLYDSWPPMEDICCDTEGILHIAYGKPAHTTDGYLGYAWKDTVWHIERLDNPGYPIAVRGASIAIDSFNYPKITYKRWDNNITELSYIEKTDTGWCRDTIDTAGVIDAGCLVFDIGNNPHVVYNAKYNNDGWLKYAWQYNGVWYVELIDTVYLGKTHTYPGLMIDEEGYAHISHNTQLSNSDPLLKYAKGKPDTLRIDVFPKISKEMLKVYPTGVKKRVNLQYALVEDNDVNISIYNIAGAKVKEVVNERKLKGKYVGRFKISNMSSGIYFCCLKTPNHLKAKKFIVIK